jgi:hypothetical protein
MPKKTASYPSHELDRFIVRFPDGMRDRIAAAAAAAGRSMNTEIVKRLSEYDELAAHLGALHQQISQLHAKATELALENERLRKTRSKESDQALQEQAQRLSQQVSMLIARLEKADPAFAATRAYFNDPKTAEEIYARRAKEGEAARARENEEHERHMAKLKAMGPTPKGPKPRSRKR